MSLGSPRQLLLVIALAAALYLLGNGRVSLWDRDEPRYAQTSRQMLESGEWVVPRFLDKVRTAKPVFIYWCQAAAMKVIGSDGERGVFAARLPSVVAMTAVLAIVGFVVLRHVSREHAFWTVFVLATSALAVWSAKASTTDAVLLLGITVAQLCLYAIWRGHATWPVMIMMAIAIAQAGLTKGPVVLGVMGMTLVALAALRLLDRSPTPRRGEPRVRPLSDPPVPSGGQGSPLRASGIAVRMVVAMVIVGALVTPWLYLVSQRESAFLGTSVSHDVLKRIAQPLEGHRGPPGYHLALIFGTFFPWSLLLPMAIVFGFKHRQTDPRVRFALAAVLGPWVMFEIVRTKLPHYMLPAFPPLAFLTADAVVRCLRDGRDDLRRRSFLVAAGILCVAIVALGVVPPFLAYRYNDPRGPALAVTCITLAVAVSVFARFLVLRPRDGLLTMGVGAAAIFAVVFGLYLPRAGSLRVSARTADILIRNGATAPGSVAMLDYKEPSLAFYQGGTIREETAMRLTDELLDRSPAWLVITDRVWANAPADVRGRLEVVGTVRGLAYANGREVETIVVRQRPADAPDVPAPRDDAILPP